MDAAAAHYGDVSRKIWEFAETGYKETRSSALLETELRAAGFQMQEHIGGIPTAFTATWGEGKPVIAIRYLLPSEERTGRGSSFIPEDLPAKTGAGRHRPALCLILYERGCREAIALASPAPRRR